MPNEPKVRVLCHRKRMKTIYISPVPFDSYKQRPHHFCEWLTETLSAEVLWIDPYPTRFARFSDLTIWKRDIVSEAETQGAKKIFVLKPRWLPLEPLPYSGLLLRFLWWKTVRESKKWLGDSEFRIVAGKPSKFLSYFTREIQGRMLFDMMDSYPDFYSGMAKSAMERSLGDALAKAEIIAISSPNMRELLPISDQAKVTLLGNAHSIVSRPSNQDPQCASKTKFGYVGSIASWFDWEFVVSLATTLTDIEIHLYGPVLTRVPTHLPGNVFIHNSIAYSRVPDVLTTFDAGLIPFKDSQLTRYVDPIKYHEYRALELPVISTSFGGIRQHEVDPGLLVLKVNEINKNALENFLEIYLPGNGNSKTWLQTFNENLELRAFLDV